MVGFPALVNDATQGLNPVERSNMSPGKNDGIVLTLNGLDEKSPERTKLDLPTAETMRAEPAIVKKIAGKDGTCPYPLSCIYDRGYILLRVYRFSPLVNASM